MGYNNEYERRVMEEEEIREQTKSEIEEYNQHIAELMSKKDLTEEEERELEEYSDFLMRCQFTCVGGF